MGGKEVALRSARTFSVPGRGRAKSGMTSSEGPAGGAGSGKADVGGGRGVRSRRERSNGFLSSKEVGIGVTIMANTVEEVSSGFKVQGGHQRRLGKVSWVVSSLGKGILRRGQRGKGVSLATEGVM